MTAEKTAYEFETIELNSDRLDRPVELKRIVSDVEIFEHIQKPYLTGRILLLDDSAFYQDADILGSERIRIKLRSLEDDAIPFTKNFFISKVEKIQKIQDNAQVIAFHIVEDIFYRSSLLNINRSYTGQPRQILKTIADNFLDKKIEYDGKSIDRAPDIQNLKCIIPNWNPLQAMQWITKRASTSRGYPFYLYSTLVGNDLKFEDLGTILTRRSLNVDGIKHIVASTKAQDTINVLQARRLVKNHEFGEQEDLLSLIMNGFVASDLEYIDTLTEGTKSFSFDSKNDLFKKLVQDEILYKEQPNPPINYDEKLFDKYINEYKSVKYTKLGGSMAFRDSDEGTNPFKYDEWQNGYSESKTAAEYKLRMIRETFDKMLKKNPVTLNFDGLELIKGDFHKSIGQNIDVVFQRTQNNHEADPDDKKKSGKYLIYSVRHMFKSSVDKYDVSALCVKIGNAKRVDT